MKENKVREIVDSYLQNDAPDAVRGSFEAWMTDGEDSVAKNRALGECWNTIEVPTEVQSPLPSAAYIISEAQVSRSSRRTRIALWVSSVAAAVLAVMCIAQFVQNKETVTCLASSEASIASFVLPDGTKLWLNKDSRLYYSGDLGGSVRKVRLEGEAYLDVAEDASHPFIVEAQNLEVKVLGTEFTVSAYNDGDVTVYLQEGCVEATGPGLSSGIILTPNQSVTYNKETGEYVKKEVRASNHTAWIGKRLVFNNTSLYDILESMRHWYNVDISCNDVDFAKSTSLSLTIRQENITEILESIELLLPVTYTEVNDNTIILIHNKI